LKIDRRLNMVLQVERGDGSIIHVHAMPVSRQVYETYFTVMAKTLSTMYADFGSRIGTCARVAALSLKKVATEDGQWDGPSGVGIGLMGEIRRLTNVVAPTPQGWTTLPFHDAVQQKLLDDEDVSEVENAICFFTLASWVHKRQELGSMIYPLVNQWGAQTTSSSVTEFAASLPTSTAAENSGATAITSSVPS